MWEIYAEWVNGNVECIDTAHEEEADTLIREYTMAFGSSAKRIWKQRG